MTWHDDHSRLALSVTAHHRVTGPVLTAFQAAVAAHGVPASTLTDNGMVFTTRLSGGKGGRNALEHELRRLGIRQKNGKPNHPPAPGERSRDSSRPSRNGFGPGPPSRMGHDSERAAIIYQHAARGADEAIRDAIDAQVEADQADDEDGDEGAAGALVPAG